MGRQGGEDRPVCRSGHLRRHGAWHRQIREGRAKPGAFPDLAMPWTGPRGRRSPASGSTPTGRSAGLGPAPTLCSPADCRPQPTGRRTPAAECVSGAGACSPPVNGVPAPEAWCHPFPAVVAVRPPSRARRHQAHDGGSRAGVHGASPARLALHGPVAGGHPVVCVAAGNIGNQYGHIYGGRMPIICRCNGLDPTPWPRHWPIFPKQVIAY